MGGSPSSESRKHPKREIISAVQNDNTLEPEDADPNKPQPPAQNYTTFKVTVNSKRLSKLKGLRPNESMSISAPIQLLSKDSKRLNQSSFSPHASPRVMNPMDEMVVGELNSEEESDKQNTEASNIKKVMGYNIKKGKRFRPSRMI